jgi:soluble lytic murein transglycosylase
MALGDLARLGEGIPSAATRDAFRRYLVAAGPLAEASLVWRAAWNAYELGDTQEFERLIRRVPSAPRASVSVRAAALYWSGRLAEHRGQKEAAKQAFLEITGRFPSHYYGMLAARRLGRPDPRVTDRAPRPADAPSKAVARRWLDAARQLDSVGLVDQALAAYRASLETAGEKSLDIALEAADRALFRKAGAEAVQLVQAGIGDRDTFSAERLALRHLRLLVPAPGAEMIAEAATPFGLDPRLVAAVALQESAFNPAAVSTAGARGLLQLMPGTGSEIAARLGIRGFRSDQLFEPAVNLRLGCAYLKSMLEQTGSIEKALASYNGGPGRAARWTSPETERDPERYVERIPILETRSYVKRILTNAWLYGIAYPEGLAAHSP